LNPCSVDFHPVNVGFLFVFVLESFVERKVLAAVKGFDSVFADMFFLLLCIRSSLIVSSFVIIFFFALLIVVSIQDNRSM